MGTEHDVQIISAPTDENPFAVIYKPAGLASAPLQEGGESALTAAARLYPRILQVTGKKQAEHGLVHRIDTDTRGLLLIASTQESYGRLLAFQKEGRFRKEYTALCQPVRDCWKLLGGFPMPPEDIGSISICMEKRTISSFFRPYSVRGSQVRPVTSLSGKAAAKKSGKKQYSTEICIDRQMSAHCFLSEGYRHQVRCHLAWIGFPIKGDRLYNPRRLPGDDFQFCASALVFPHPLTGKAVEIRI